MSPALELQQVIVSDLKAHGPLVALVGGRVFDDRRKPSIYPFVSWGPEFSNDASNDCFDVDDVFLQIDIWSKQPSKLECKSIVDVIKRRIRSADYSLSINALCFLEYEGDRIIDDIDDQIHHGIITLRATVEPR